MYVSMAMLLSAAVVAAAATATQQVRLTPRLHVLDRIMTH